VLDNLSTHTAAALYQSLPAEEARRILRRLEFHYTPKHASWLNMAEIEFSVLARECLDRRIPSAEVLEHQIAAYKQERNRTKATINWRFTNQDARTKLKRLYPSIED
ncbi:MAG: transposase, partial [Gammaproteobacteria bacterium]